MKDFAAMGGELFVMDDGWFGNKYRRVQDNSSLGDWVVDTQNYLMALKVLQILPKNMVLNLVFGLNQNLLILKVN